jgi:hypothetical protein
MASAKTDILLSGEEIYEALKRRLEAQYRGAYVMINLRDGQFVVGETTSDVHSKFIAQFGADAAGWCTRIGVSVFATL